MANQPAIVRPSDAICDRHRLLGARNAEPRQVDRRQAHIEMKHQLLSASGLTMGKSRELLRISEDQFDLKAQAVELNDLLSCQVAIGRSQNDVGLRRRVNKHDHTKVAPESRARSARC